MTDAERLEIVRNALRDILEVAERLKSWVPPRYRILENFDVQLDAARKVLKDAENPVARI